jgi:8-oxo-dGTP pyrophosphatase MutT (NUDIX family)
MTDAEGGPFSSDDLDRVTRYVVDAWRSGIERDWSARAGTLEWTCTRTADHTVDAVLAVAFFLASRNQDGYPEWGWAELTMGPDARPEHLVEAAAAVGRVLSALVVTAEPGTRAAIWRLPVVGTGTPDDFAARGALEMILHAHDVCAGLGLPFDPPADVCTRLRDHTRGWPHWSMPNWSPAPTTDDAWSDLLAGSGRTRTERDDRWHAVHDAVSARVPADDREVDARAQFLAGLERLPFPFSEDADPTHVTASAIVVGSRGTVLHVHRRTGAWLQPGGHVEPGEEPWDAAWRETMEETGLAVRHPEQGPELVHVDVHDAPRGHLHLDLRYLLLAPADDPAPAPGESQEVRWFSWDDAEAVADESLRNALLAVRERAPERRASAEE